MKTGILSMVEILDDGTENTVIGSAGTVDYIKGEILLSTVNITSTLNNTGVVEVQAIPESNDVVGLKELYLNFSLSKSTINMVRDVISSGDEITGTTRLADLDEKEGQKGSFVRLVRETTFTNQRGDIVAKSRQIGIAR